MFKSKAPTEPINSNFLHLVPASASIASVRIGAPIPVFIYEITHSSTCIYY